jgi:hypothetical protein
MEENVPDISQTQPFTISWYFFPLYTFLRERRRRKDKTGVEVPKDTP